MEIGTYIEKSVDHELSGNIIDLCPVGALNNKPYRFSARAWEMLEKPLISPHDCAGSNLSAHVLRGTVRRIVPAENDAINESWISDRDRFSCHGLYAEDRLAHPMIKRDQEWVQVTWQEAIEHTAEALQNAVGNEPESVGVLSSPSATIEELYLLRKIAAHLGSDSIDYRLRRTDFRDEQNDPAWPWLGLPIADIDTQQGILVVGSNLRMESPIIAHRVRKAALAGAEVAFVNPADYPVTFGRKAYVEASLEHLAASLAGVLVAAAEAAGTVLSGNLAALCAGIAPTAEQRAAAAVLAQKDRAWLVLGQIAERHPKFTEIRYIASELAKVSSVKLGYLPEGANAAGAAMLGFVPRDEGLNISRMLGSPRRAYVLHGMEPARDTADAELAEAALKSADVVVGLTAFADESLLECCNVLLPIAAFAETQGTYVNAEGRWQSFAAATNAFGDSRPAWRILRVLATTLEAPDSEYQTIEEIQAAIANLIGQPAGDNTYAGSPALDLAAAEVDADQVDVPIYSIDALVRRSDPLQQTAVALSRKIAE